MRLTALLKELRTNGVQIEIVNRWQMPAKHPTRRGVTLGDPRKFFPNPPGPTYQVDTTKGSDPELTQDEEDAIRRRFSPDRIGEMM